MRTVRPLCAAVFALAAMGAAMPAETERIDVDASKPLRAAAACKLGINVNYLLDHDRNRPPGARPLAGALKELGVQALRYPGGEKADSYLWSVPPFEQPRPTLARTGPTQWPSSDRTLFEADGRTFKRAPLDFDAFMDLCKATGAEPVLVVCYDSMYLPAVPGGTAPTREQLLETAVAWVRYANVTKKYGVKYWEIGNESYMKGYNGFATPEDYAKDLRAFSEAMKKVDPTIQIGANGPSEAGDWWKAVLPQASGAIDFLAVHSYPCWEWKSYDYYPAHAPDLAKDEKTATDAVQKFARAEDAKRLRLCVTELNSADWLGFPEQKGWKHLNNLGHALVLFDLLGSAMQHPRTDMQLLWNTRWMKNETDPELWDALDAQNRLLPTGRVLAIWRAFLKEQLVAATSGKHVRAFASWTPGTQALSVFLLNKDKEAHACALTLKGVPAKLSGSRHLFSGKDAEDKQPAWTRAGECSIEGGTLSLDLPAVSLTVLDLAP
ncbi:MAG: alpha-L-arabinofuranosidase [Planctomycetota bacterium]|nr:alpha-L-arabinofuranosidase [Planctomycetota bacterium]